MVYVSLYGFDLLLFMETAPAVGMVMEEET